MVSVINSPNICVALLFPLFIQIVKEKKNARPLYDLNQMHENSVVFFHLLPQSVEPHLNADVGST